MFLCTSYMATSQLYSSCMDRILSVHFKNFNVARSKFNVDMKTQLRHGVLIFIAWYMESMYIVIKHNYHKACQQRCRNFLSLPQKPNIFTIQIQLAYNDVIILQPHVLIVQYMHKNLLTIYVTTQYIKLSYCIYTYVASYS